MPCRYDPMSRCHIDKRESNLIKESEKQSHREGFFFCKLRVLFVPCFLVISVSDCRMDIECSCKTGGH